MRRPASRVSRRIRQTPPFHVFVRGQRSLPGAIFAHFLPFFLENLRRRRPSAAAAGGTGCAVWRYRCPARPRSGPRFCAAPTPPIASTPQRGQAARFRGPRARPPPTAIAHPPPEKPFFCSQVWPSVWARRRQDAARGPRGARVWYGKTAGGTYRLRRCANTLKTARLKPPSPVDHQRHAFFHAFAKNRPGRSTLLITKTTPAGTFI